MESFPTRARARKGDRGIHHNTLHRGHFARLWNTTRERALERVRASKQDTRDSRFSEKVGRRTASERELDSPQLRERGRDGGRHSSRGRHRSHSRKVARISLLFASAFQRRFRIQTHSLVRKLDEMARRLDLRKNKAPRSVCVFFSQRTTTMIYDLAAAAAAAAAGGWFFTHKVFEKECGLSALRIVGALRRRSFWRGESWPRSRARSTPPPSTGS